MKKSFLAGLCGVALGLAHLSAPAAQAAVQARLDPAYPGERLGPQQAKGAMIWSHGRSISSEDADSPPPPYLASLHDSGWDVLRFNRQRDGDTLRDSAAELVRRVGELKAQGYRRVVLAGQSFGAFVALMAADASDEVDAVVATAPAAFGSFDEFYDSWTLNATRLYPLLEKTRRARVMLFFFHGDDFDPGGRGERARAIFSSRGVGYAVVDQPAFLVSHWASTTGLFLRRYGPCIRDFAEADGLSGEMVCRPSWGQRPSSELSLPGELRGFSVPPARMASAAMAGGSAAETHTPAPASVPGSAPVPGPAQGSELGAATKTAASAPGPESSRTPLDTWYGFYPNGREVLIAVEAAHEDQITAIYAVGPGVDKDEKAMWVRRKGRIAEDELVFEQEGRSTLRFHPRADGGLSAIWISADGKVKMRAAMRRIEPLLVAPEPTATP